ncbi:MAG TPA: cytochrome c peroxidase [Chitinophagaceae bacterium]|nr:cytochrome c peroxidase [Chitinophagaceae bacterium]
MHPVRKPLVALFLLGTSVVTFAHLLGSCRRYPDLSRLQALQQEVPTGFPVPAYRFQDNPLTKEGFELGRKLFYDNRLSTDGYHDCGSCHQQVAAFGTYDHDLSHGIEDTHTLRNAPVLFNLAWYRFFHWDGQFGSFEAEAAHPLNDPIKMGGNFNFVINRINGDADYRRRFREVFGSAFIRPEFVMKALAQFTGSLTSANSKYDRYRRGETSFTPEEQRGYLLFQTKCATCHPEPLFTDDRFHNIGLPLDPRLSDFGRMRITGNRDDSLKFRTPTLRNVFASANYMHDGRFGTLGQVLNHYRFGIQAGPTLDPLLTGGIVLTGTETLEVIAFLRTLTDSAFLANPRYGPPG